MSRGHPREKAQWEEEGWSLLRGLFSEEELQAAQAALPALFPTAEEFAQDVDPERNRPFRIDSHSVMPTFPFESSALNRLVLHENVISLAQEFLELDDVRLYQGMLSAKYAEGALEDEQLLHVDYGNHTLVVPRPEVGYQQLELFVYLSDVTPEKAATRMVSRRLTTGIPVERTYLSAGRLRRPLCGRGARLGPGRVDPGLPARRLSPWRADDGARCGALHAARLVQTRGHRLARFAGLAGRSRGHGVASVHADAHRRQLAVLGFPEPGHPYWTEETLRGRGGALPTPRYDAVAPGVARQARRPGGADRVEHRVRPLPRRSRVTGPGG